jgi:hypothetical protein
MPVASVVVVRVSAFDRYIESFGVWEQVFS